MIYIWLDSITCFQETDEVGADEPYVIVAAVDLKNTVEIAGHDAPIPASSAFLWGPFNDVDAGETRVPGFLSFWGLDRHERGLATPGDAIFIAAMMENDDGNPGAARGLVASSVSATILATLGADRQFVVDRLRQAVDDALKIPTGGPSLDEKIGGAQEVRFSAEQIALAETGQKVVTTLTFEGDGGKYGANFQARNRGQNDWRFCFRCHSMFFDGNKDNKGRCPAGAGHAAAGFMFFLPHDAPPRPDRELGWSLCANCFAMFKRGRGLGSALGDPGVCPAGGGHAAQGFKFVLPLPNPGPGQDDWTRCGKCRSLFWDGEQNKGVCVTGGGHERWQTLQHTPGNSVKLDFEP